MIRPALPYLLLSLLAAGASGAQTPAPSPLTIPMRDGVKLAGDLWLPRGPGRHPVLLVRTPYPRPAFEMADWARYFAAHGYAFVVQSTRGRGGSEGEFHAFFGEGRDGYDSIEWLARQSWSTGRIGTLGLSYLGTAQWLAAREHPPHLTCMAPTASGGRWLDELPWMGGAFMPQFALSWINETSTPFDRDPETGVDWDKVLAHRPLLTSDSVLGRVMPLYREWLSHPTLDHYWGRLRFIPEDFAAIGIPTLNVTGWFDGDQPGALFYWRGLMAATRNPSRHFLIVGPWRHPETFRGGALKVGDLELSSDSRPDMKPAHLAFFDWCLRGATPRYAAPRARVYVTGENVWKTFDTYPPTAAAPRRLYLGSSGHANTGGGDGTLAWAPNAEAPPDSFTYDPGNPVPDNMDNWGADRRAVERRTDVLVYTSEVLQEPVEVIGDVTVDLEASSDALDTDFTAILSDVGTDGLVRKLGPMVGIRRARYRNGYARAEWLTPGRAAHFPIELFDLAHRFLPGHRIRLEISSSAAPLYGPNQNTGNPVATDTVWKVAHQTVYHDRARPSALILPVMPH